MVMVRVDSCSLDVGVALLRLSAAALAVAYKGLLGHVSYLNEFVSDSEECINCMEL